jgi:trimethylamine:corrinoid methyltransferase-like protein
MDVTRIHQTMLDVLEKIGLGDAPAVVRELALSHGCRINEHGRLCFPRALVEDVIAGAGRNFTLHARDPIHDMDISGARVHYGASGVAVLVPDFETGRYRPSTIADLYDFARLVDVLENVHFFNRPVIGRDITDPAIHDINMSYVSMAARRAYRRRLQRRGHVRRPPTCSTSSWAARGVSASAPSAASAPAPSYRHCGSPRRIARSASPPPASAFPSI